MQRKIAAILAADVAGYSRLIATDEEDTLTRLLGCRAIFEDFIQRGGGRVFNTAGDSVLAEFSSAVEALRAAVDIQESIRTRNLEVPDARQMRFRIGITIGDVVERDGDLLGDGVNIAARLEALAVPGGICISRNMHEQVQSKLAVTFRDLGLQSVKNIPAPIQAFAIDPEGVVATAVAAAPPEAQRRASPLPEKRRRVGFAAGVALACIVAAVAAVALLVRGQGPGGASLALLAPPKVYGFSDQALTATPSDEQVRSLDHIPFVCGKCQTEIQAAMLGQPNKAIALSDTGAYGFAVDAPTPDEARLRALADCTRHRVGDGYCDLYALNGVVVWSRQIPLPPAPWVADGAQRRPFDPKLLGGAWGTQPADVERRYASAYSFKALALGKGGRWSFRSGRNSEADAARAVLELCGDHTGSACRLVAINNDFVVDPTSGPVPFPASTSK